MLLRLVVRDLLSLSLSLSLLCIIDIFSQEIPVSFQESLILIENPKNPHSWPFGFFLFFNFVLKVRIMEVFTTMGGVPNFVPI